MSNVDRLLDKLEKINRDDLLLFLEDLIAKAGEEMREKCVYAADNPLWDTEEAIRAVPAVTLEVAINKAILD